MKILIGALSGWSFAERREKCRATWFPDAAAAGIDAVFLVADTARPQSCRRDGDTLYLPCPDDYQTLPQRTLWFCRWALSLPPSEPAAAWDYLFKCDDDTYVSIPRLAAFDPAGRDYIGAEWRPGSGYASGGAGYLLSRRAATIVAERLANVLTGAEDLEVGNLLRAAGVEFFDRREIPDVGRRE